MESGSRSQYPNIKRPAADAFRSGPIGSPCQMRSRPHLALHEPLKVLTQLLFAERVTGAFTRRAVLALGLHLGIGAKRHINLDGLVIAHHG